LARHFGLTSGFVAVSALARRTNETMGVTVPTHPDGIKNDLPNDGIKRRRASRRSETQPGGMTSLTAGANLA
jgi:hypothetical protein